MTALLGLALACGPRMNTERRVAPLAGTDAGVVTYHGGTVLSGAQIVLVLWGADVAGDVVDQTTSTYQTVTEVSDFDWISEYDTASQHIGRATFLGQVVIDPGDAGTTLRDGGTLLLEQDIVAELVRQLDAGLLPTATEEHYYAVYFPRGVRIESGLFLDASCQVWSAYHGDLAPASVGTYAVFPACGQNSPNAVHELFEAVTDPHDNDGWTTQDGSEIADLCAKSLTSLPLRDGGALSIQRLWSNRSSGCIASGNEFNVSIDPDVAPAARELTFTVSVTTPRSPYASLGWQVSGLPDGGTSTMREDAPARWTLTVALPPVDKAFSFTIAARSESWKSSAAAGVYPSPASSHSGAGCSQSSVDPLPGAFLGALVLGALGLRGRARSSRM